MKHLTIIVVLESFAGKVKVVSHFHGSIVIAVTISKEFVDEFRQRLRSSILEAQSRLFLICSRSYLFIRQSTFGPDLLN